MASEPGSSTALSTRNGLAGLDPGSPLARRPGVTSGGLSQVSVGSDQALLQAAPTSR